MSPHLAKCILLRDRMDWNHAHLPWIPESMYRLYRSVRH